MKIFRKFLALATCIITVLNFSLVSFAGNTDVISNYSYSITDEGFQDTFNVRENDGTVSTITRTVSPSGQSTVILRSPSGDRVFTGHIDYELLIIAATGTPKSARVNVHDTNIFNHNLINRNSVTVTREDGEFAAGAITAIISSNLDVVGAGLSKLMNIVIKNTNDPNCAYITCDESIYEVIFKADNVYYTHCYHENVIGYKSNGSILPNSSYNITYQQVGG